MPSFHFDAPGFQLFPSISPVAFWLFKPPAQGRLSGGSGESPLAPMARTKSVLCRGLFLESGEVYASPFFSLAESRHIAALLLVNARSSSSESSRSTLNLHG